MGVGTLFTVAERTVYRSCAEFVPFQPDTSVSYLERRYTNEQSAFIEVGDARIHYRAEGEPAAPTVLLLHGTYSSLHTWNEWVRRLAGQFHVVRLDLPGSGLTGPRKDGSHSIGYLIETVGDFCDTLGLTDVAVAGNSLGGSVGWRLAVDRPDLVDRLVLLDPGGLSLLRQFARILRAAGSDFAPRYLTPRVLIRTILNDAYADRRKVTASLVRRYHDLLLRPGNRRAIIEIAKAAAADRPGSTVDSAQPPVPTLPSDYESSVAVPDGYDHSRIAVPTLFQWGEDDEWLPVELGRERAATVPDSQFVSYPGVGHAPMEEAPEQTVSDAIDFLSE